MKRNTTAVLSGLLVVALSVGVQPPVWARTTIHDAAESGQYGRKFGGMLGRGLINVFSSFVDVIVQTVNETKEGPPLVGTFTGLGRGLGCGLLRLGSGAVDLVTFWVPGFNGMPVSPSYQNCVPGDEDRAYEQYQREAFPAYQSAAPAPQPVRPMEPVAPAPESTQTERRWTK